MDLKPGSPDVGGLSPLVQARKRGNTEMVVLMQRLAARADGCGMSKHDME
jgi:hypothetical protein